jgi:hypothetical protein
MPSVVPEPRRDSDLHFVLCDFGRLGQAFMETDATSAGRDDIVRNLLAGEYKRPVRIISFNVAEGWSRDVSTEIAAEVASVAARQGQSLTDGTRDFVAACLDRPHDRLRQN